MEQNIVSTLQAGCFTACFLTGWLTNRYGRRWPLIGVGMFTTIGVIFQDFVRGYLLFVVILPGWIPNQPISRGLPFLHAPDYRNLLGHLGTNARCLDS